MKTKQYFHQWLDDHEAYLRSAEVVAVTLIGSYIGWQQYKIAEHSVEVAEKELRVRDVEFLEVGR